MIKLIREFEATYRREFDALASAISGSGSYVAPTSFPCHLSYFRQTAPDPSILEKAFFSLRTDGGDLLALLHGLENAQESELGQASCLGVIIEDRDRIEKHSRSEIVSALRSLMSDYSQVKVRDYCIEGRMSCLSTLILSEGADHQTNFTRVIDLEKGIASLWRDVRKSYRPIINRYNRTARTDIVQGQDLSLEDFKQIFDLHKQVAGRQTRSWQSWLEQFELLKAKDAILIRSRQDDVLTGFGMFLQTPDAMFYSSSAFPDGFQDASHAIIWSAVSYAIENKLMYFDIGQQNFPVGFEETRDKKLENISFFKRGFGGSDQIYLDINYRSHQP